MRGEGVHGADWIDGVEQKEREILILKRALRLTAETLVAFSGNDTKPEAWICRYMTLAEDQAKRTIDKRYPYDTDKYVEFGE